MLPTYVVLLQKHNTTSRVRHVHYQTERGAFDDMSEQQQRAGPGRRGQGDIYLDEPLTDSGAPTLRHVARTRGDYPCPTMSCACTGATRPSLQPTAPAPEQIRKVQKLSVVSENEQDMDIAKRRWLSFETPIRYDIALAKKLHMRAL